MRLHIMSLFLLFLGPLFEPSGHVKNDHIRMQMSAASSLMLFPIYRQLPPQLIKEFALRDLVLTLFILRPWLALYSLGNTAAGMIKAGKVFISCSGNCKKLDLYRPARPRAECSNVRLGVDTCLWSLCHNP